MQKSAASLKINRMVGLAVLAAVIFVLQYVASYVRFGTVSITLVLIPIVVGAAVYGIMAGAVLGFAFGIAALVFDCFIVGGAYVIFAANPAMTVFLCLFKGTMAGLAAGLVYTAVARKNIYAGIICAAVISPVVNTGIFITGMVLFYRDLLIGWAGGTQILYFAVITFVGTNFLIEFISNIVLSPAALRIINAVKK